MVRIVIYQAFQLMVQCFKVLPGKFAQAFVRKGIVIVAAQFFQLNVYLASQMLLVNHIARRCLFLVFPACFQRFSQIVKKTLIIFLNRSAGAQGSAHNQSKQQKSDFFQRNTPHLQKYTSIVLYRGLYVKLFVDKPDAHTFPVKIPPFQKKQRGFAHFSILVFRVM